MKAIAITRSTNEGSSIEFLLQVDLPVPVAAGRDLLIEVQSNPYTVGEYYGAITAENLQKAHAHIESGRIVDKIIMEGF
ncbi:hypothetical protein JJV61_002512 [Salmonella enterica subsp. enterica serovar Javiana]|nr:hypothetical protein [Salmonella enterica subsp. enterica serovar Javiana]